MGEGVNKYMPNGRSRVTRESKLNKQGKTGAERLAEKSNINGGLTKAQEMALSHWEDKHRDRKTERVAAFDENGRIVNQSKSGTKDSTKLGYIPENCVITHNHPTEAKGMRQTTAYGVSFSHADIRSTMRRNAKEIRAVAGEYTYSLRRPKDGWKGNPDVVYMEYTAAYNRHAKELFAHRDKINYRTDPKTYLERHQRANTLAAHRATQDIAKKYGMIYTRKATRKKQK